MIKQIKLIVLFLVWLLFTFVLLIPAQDKKQYKILCEQRTNTTSDIYIMDSDGRNPKKLTANKSESLHACWSPNCKKIAFYSKKDKDSNYEIYVMDSDGKNPIKLTDNNKGNALNYWLSWSPDGKKILFQSKRDGNEEIYVIDADGKNLTRLTHNPEGSFYPSWSPDGKSIIFCLKSKDKGGIYTMDAKGENQIRLTDDRATDFPRWSPDGKKIVFPSYRELYIMDADGQNQKKLTNNPGFDCRYEFLAWSHNGLKIAFALKKIDNSSNLYVIDADGNNLMKLTNNPESQRVSDLFPCWSSDDRKIVFQRNAG